MCRLLGIVTEFPSGFRFGLADAPRSLATLSDDNPHGWGIAVHDPGGGWSVEKCPMRADRCDHFRDAAAYGRGDMLIAHVRSSTVGAVTFANTHPFRRGPWVFAHNGTVDDLGFLAERTTASRRAEIEGDTDSERLFAFLLSAVDRTSGDIDGAVRGAAEALARHPAVGACNFLLSDGAVLHAFRLGRPMFFMAREYAVATDTECETGAQVAVSDLHGRAFFVASEPLGGEGSWSPLVDGDLLRIDRGGARHWRALRSVHCTG